MSLALDVLSLVAVAVFVGTEDALEVAVVLDWVVGGTAFAVGPGGLVGLGAAAAGVLVAVTVAGFAVAVVLGALAAGVTGGAVFKLAGTALDFAVPAVTVFGAVVAAGLPPSAVVMDLVEVEVALGVVAVVVEVLGAGLNNEVAGAEATLVAVLAGGATLGA